jgi:hypothetical protein
VFGWGYGGSGAANGHTPPRFSLAHGIAIPAGANISVESSSYSFVSLAGYEIQ